MASSLRLRAGMTILGLTLMGASLSYAAGTRHHHRNRSVLQTTEQNAPANDAQISRAEAEAQLNGVWETVRDRLYDPKLNGVDWAAIRAAYRARLPQVRTRLELTDLMNAMLGELRVSHTLYTTDEDFEYSMLPAVMTSDMKGHQVEHIGVLGRREGGAYRVAASLDGSPARAAGIETGDRLLTVDGQPFTSASSFRNRAGESVRLVLQRPGEPAPRTVRVTPIKQNPLAALLAATERSVQIWNLGGKRLGYVHLWAMASDRFRETLEEIVLGRLHNTDGLILDLRDGYGGKPWGFDDVFLQPDILWEQRVRGSQPSQHHTGYSRPLVVLINEGTRSSKEFLAYQFKVSRRATLVGTRTASAFLGAAVFPIGKSGLVELPVEGLRVDGRPLEGEGVTPNIEAASDAPYTPHDGQLTRAQQILLESINR
jgi:carboxyl-terminal processing protease